MGLRAHQGVIRSSRELQETGRGMAVEFHKRYNAFLWVSVKFREVPRSSVPRGWKNFNALQKFQSGA